MSNKLNMHTKDIVGKNIEAVGALFPHCVTEAIDEYGNVKRLINFEILRGELSEDLASDVRERYQFTWPDKSVYSNSANAPIRKTLRPCREESTYYDKTENLYIEGDNLDALKLLRETYLGKIKMIYIDPPYNTGSDFIYRDNFKIDNLAYQDINGVYDEDDNRLFKNTDSNGRFHTDWLNMIYPRLKLAKDLLSDAGVIFISIDDNEIENLKIVCNEIFGRSNFIANIVREVIRGGSKSKYMRVVHDYVLCYAKRIDDVEFYGTPMDGIELDLEDKFGRYAKGRELNKWGAGSRREDSPSMYYPIKGPNDEDVYPIRNDGTDGRWRLGKKKMAKLLAEDNAIFVRRDDGTYIVYEKIRDSTPRTKQFTTWFTGDYLNSKGTEQLKDIFKTEKAIFDYAKPSKLISDLLLMTTKDDDIILDFFSGSATAAHAVMDLNASDGGMRKFIMIQLPEETAEDSIARKAGFTNICEIGKERIRRIGKRILQKDKQHKLSNSNDTGCGCRI